MAIMLLTKDNGKKRWRIRASEGGKEGGKKEKEEERRREKRIVFPSLCTLINMEELVPQTVNINICM